MMPGLEVRCINVDGLKDSPLELGTVYVVTYPKSWTFEGDRYLANGIRVRRKGERKIVGGPLAHWDSKRFESVTR